MTASTVTDVRALVLESAEFGEDQARTLREIMENDATAVSRLRETAQVLQEQARKATGAEGERLKMRLGIVEYLLGRTSYAVEHLKAASHSGLAMYYLGRTLQARGDFAGAATAYEKAGKHGYDTTTSTLLQAGSMYLAGDKDKAKALLKSIESQASKTAEYHFQLGRMLADAGEDLAAASQFEHALDIDPRHPEALFHMAFLSDLHGEEDDAIQYYERCIARSPVHLGALFNLGTLLEDKGQYERASRCFRRVLNIYPTHGRSRLFLKDCLASQEMYLDEESERSRDRLTQMLQTPVTDFELSVRSRNCLRKMNIRSLGDLVRCTEQELLDSKNFGETSLQEIKELLGAKGLRLGMITPDASGASYIQPDELTEQERTAMGKPITDLNLSVRARKCMARLGIATIGELCSQSADKLLEVKNFGVTSLNEIRAKLGEVGLKLHGD